MTSPFHLFNKKNYIKDKSIEENRIEICKKCDCFFAGICKKCGCFMELKVKLKESSCPLNKW
jgi:hypothetical protein